MKLKTTVTDITTVDEPYRNLYTQSGEVYHFTGVEGLRTQDDIDRIQNALAKERNDHKETRQKLSEFGTLTADEVNTQLARISELEIAAKGKIDDKTIQTLVDGRIRGVVAPIERERDNAREQLARAQNEIQTFALERRSNSIRSSIRDAAAKAGVIPEAIEDAIMYGSSVFTVNDAGNVVVSDESRAFTPGVSPEVWLTEVKSNRKHWWPASIGGGASGGSSGDSSVNPWADKTLNYTEQGRILRSDPARAQQLAKAAGKTIG